MMVASQGNTFPAKTWCDPGTVTRKACQPASALCRSEEDYRLRRLGGIGLVTRPRLSP